MPQSIGVITPSSCELKTIESILGLRWQIERLPRQSGRTDLHIQQINNESDEVYVSIAELDARETADDYAECEELPDALRNTLKGSSFYLFSFNDLELVKSVMREFLSRLGADLEAAWVDNDYGQLIRASVFLHNVTSDPEWDWRDMS